MSDPFGGEAGKSKAVRLADAVNRLIYELIIRCTKDQTEGVRNYYDVGVIGYGGHVGPAWSGKLAGRELVPIREVADNAARVETRRRQVEDGAGGLVSETVRFPVWFDAVAENGTPMCEALRYVHRSLSGWVQRNPDSFPPIVINITDGEATDGDPRGPAQDIHSLATGDGNVLLFNAHLSSQSGAPALYPSDESNLPDQYARLLFQMSSLLPPHIRQTAVAEGYLLIDEQSRGFVFNADIVEVIKFLDIGTRPTNLR